LGERDGAGVVQAGDYSVEAKAIRETLELMRDLGVSYHYPLPVPPPFHRRVVTRPSRRIICILPSELGIPRAFNTSAVCRRQCPEVASVLVSDRGVVSRFHS
jgi:hypothetical protein